MTVPVQVRVRRPCEECGGNGVVMGPLWRAYYADREQADREQAAMLAAAPAERLTTRLRVFYEWWAVHVGGVTSIVDGSTQVVVPPEEVPCGECVDGWVERWVPIEDLALVAA